ncbi:MAG: molybdopterin-binding protein [Thermoplasmata archaeon]|nr:molybdopterin-binding protein [Thermoplasmata archaeon]
MTHQETPAEPPSEPPTVGGTRSLGFSVLLVSDTLTEEDDVSGRLAVALLKGAGHRVLHYEIVANSIADVRDKLEPFLDERPTEVAVTIGGTGVSSRDLSVPAAEAMGGKKIEGFGELYRALSFQDVGALAILSRSNLYLVRHKPVFVLPGSERAVRTAIEKLILPAVRHLVEELER